MGFSKILTASLFAGLLSALPLNSAPLIERSVNSLASLNGTAGVPHFGNENGNFMPAKKEFSTLATGGVVQGSLAVNSIVNEDGIGEGSDTYRRYTGDGGPEAGWPAMNQWVSFRAMFDNNKVLMFGACGWNAWGAVVFKTLISFTTHPSQKEFTNFDHVDDSGPEVGAIYNAIQQVAQETKVDHRFILATIIQESGGCVRVPTTNNGVRNPGLMQCHNGDGTCHSDITGQVQFPCPDGVITQMVREGTAGTRNGDGLAQVINQAVSTGGWGSRAFYIAARLYNSGSVNQGNMNDPVGATPCYVMDIANRLTGWTLAASQCGL
ncbi:hypothetical protein HYALB_00011883 [Hymenoscyphus albidus]|uniref:Glycoside hydrolase family 23 protein n=1 Tax=Hymenoscyphus albidus TaxID=595503 RepID=A0A9N9Q3S0_9HELO|nr:hypothetical protein HYALB_00011883 [Hymenoscyphus albidus]